MHNHEVEMATIDALGAMGRSTLSGYKIKQLFENYKKGQGFYNQGLISADEYIIALKKLTKLAKPRIKNKQIWSDDMATSSKEIAPMEDWAN